MNWLEALGLVCAFAMLLAIACAYIGAFEPPEEE
jgi:hypothetical protein